MGHMPLSRNLAMSRKPAIYRASIQAARIQIAIIESIRTTTVRACTARCAKTVQHGADQVPQALRVTLPTL
jgi:hypothetical protein